jgi:hypothetical protein
MDIQFWIWLIVIVITLIARVSKKKAQPGAPSQGGYNEPTTTSEGAKPVSFEDLLREIQAAKAPKPVVHKPAVLPQNQKTYDYVDYDDDIEEEIQPNKRSDYRSEVEIYETYEKAKSAAFNRKSLEETLDINDTEVKFGRLRGFDSYNNDKKPVASQYVKELRNPASFKRAFILSEILKRRY